MLALEMRRIIVSVLAVVGVVVILGLLASFVAGFVSGVRGDGGSDHAIEIADRIGASYCSQSGYQLTNRLDGSHEVIYDCTMSTGKSKCVTEEGGIAHDSTFAVKLVFANALGGTKPFCATG